MKCIYCDNDLLTGDIGSTCSRCKKLQEEFDKEHFRQINPGWVCPNCGSVYGPFVHECGRCNGPMKITC